MKKQLDVQVIIKLTIEGFHNWPDAIDEVDFLEHRHRHSFEIEAAVRVSHTDRDKEIFLLRNMVREYLNESYGYPCEFGSMSCEDIAVELFEFLQPENPIYVKVMEEQTGGAKIQ